MLSSTPQMLPVPLFGSIRFDGVHLSCTRLIDSQDLTALQPAQKARLGRTPLIQPNRTTAQPLPLDVRDGSHVVALGTISTLDRFVFLEKIRVWAGRDRARRTQRRSGMVTDLGRRVGDARCPRADRRHNGGQAVEGQCTEAPPLSRARMRPRSTVAETPARPRRRA